MKVKILSAISSVGWGGRKYGPFEADQIADLPDGLVQKLVGQGLAAEVIEEPEKKLTLATFMPKKLEGPTSPQKPETEPKPEGKKVEIDPKLAGWLSSKGFTLGPEGVAFTRTERLETGDVVKLQVDFSDTPKGARYGYRLDIEKDPPEWKSDPHLHDHPLLLQFKQFRDDLLAQREARVQISPAAPKVKNVRDQNTRPNEHGLDLLFREEVTLYGDEFFIPRDLSFAEEIANPLFN